MGRPRVRSHPAHAPGLHRARAPRHRPPRRTDLLARPGHGHARRPRPPRRDRGDDPRPGRAVGPGADRGGRALARWRHRVPAARDAGPRPRRRPGQGPVRPPDQGWGDHRQRVSTDHQSLETQHDALTAGGCERIFGGEDQAHHPRTQRPDRVSRGQGVRGTTTPTRIQCQGSTATATPSNAGQPTQAVARNRQPLRQVSTDLPRRTHPAGRPER